MMMICQTEKDFDKTNGFNSLSVQENSTTYNNNLRTSSKTASRVNQDNSPRINRGTGYENQRVVNVTGLGKMECQKPKRAKDAAYHKEKMLLCKQEEAGVQLNAELGSLFKSGPFFDAEPLHKYKTIMIKLYVFAIKNEHHEQPEYVNDIYLEEQGDTNIIIDSLDMCYDRKQDDQDDTDELDQERDLLASLIEKLKCEIDDNKNRNKFLEFKLRLWVGK
ncbi:hypothetical protein Tco_0981261 [Tanacetum coccineum]